MEPGISQGSSVSSIFFLIYINRVFNKVLETSLIITPLSFVKNLGFIASDNSIKKIIKALEKIAKEIIEWGRLNTIIYNMSKMEVMLFLKSHQ